MFKNKFSHIIMNKMLLDIAMFQINVIPPANSSTGLPLLHGLPGN